MPRKNISGADYLTEEGKRWYGKFKNQKDLPLPPNFEEEVQKEQAWLGLIFKKLQAERQPDWAIVKGCVVSLQNLVRTQVVCAVQLLYMKHGWPSSVSVKSLWKGRL